MVAVDDDKKSVVILFQQRNYYAIAVRLQQPDWWHGGRILFLHAGRYPRRWYIFACVSYVDNPGIEKEGNCKHHFKI